MVHKISNAQIGQSYLSDPVIHRRRVPGTRSIDMFIAPVVRVLCSESNVEVDLITSVESIYRRVDPIVYIRQLRSLQKSK